MGCGTELMEITGVEDTVVAEDEAETEDDVARIGRETCVVVVVTAGRLPVEREDEVDDDAVAKSTARED